MYGEKENLRIKRKEAWALREKRGYLHAALRRKSSGVFHREKEGVSSRACN